MDSDLRARIESEIRTELDSLRAVRDELQVQVHLGAVEARYVLLRGRGYMLSVTDVERVERYYLDMREIFASVALKPATPS